MAKVPNVDKNSILRAKLLIRKSFAGFLKSVLYQGEAFSIYYELDNGRTHSHKIVPKNAEDGIWINPLILAPENNFTEPLVKKIKLVCWDSSMVQSDFTISFEEIKFPQNYNFLKTSFNKSDTLEK